MRTQFTPENINPDKDVALTKPDFLYYPDEPEECFNRRGRRWQSAATIAKVKSGRLFAAYSGGGVDEGPSNYNCMSYSDDDGYTWRNDYLIIDHPEAVRMHEPILWVSPDGVLWHFWAQSYVYWDGRGGVWASRCENPDDDMPHWSEPVRLCDGVMACKPIVRHDGAYLYPVSIWHNFVTRFYSCPEFEKSNVYISTDGGRSVSYLGSAYHEDTTFDENCICERRDGSLLMLMRLSAGIAYSESFDGGKTWTKSDIYCVPSPSARMYLGKFPDGSFFMIHHHNFDKRNNMTAMLSDDEGRSYSHFLLLDGRSSVAYPDAFVDDEGKVYAVYDRERYGDKEIHLAVFRKEDILAGKCVTEGARIGGIVCKSYGAKRTAEEKGRSLWPRKYCDPLKPPTTQLEQYYKSFV